MAGEPKHTKTKVLIIEDDPDIVELLEYNLERDGFEILTARDGELGIREAERAHPAVILLDLMLPRVDGLEVCRTLRSRSGTKDIPIIMVTAKGEESDVVLGLGIGADDYVVKPFGIDELLARVRAALRRTPDANDGTQTSMSDGDFRIDLSTREIEVAGISVHMTPKEFDLLVFLFRHRGKVVTHRAILTAIWGGHSTEQTEYLRVFVGQLRKKVEKDPSQPKYIRTEPWVGYRFDPSG